MVAGVFSLFISSRNTFEGDTIDVSVGSLGNEWQGEGVGMGLRIEDSEDQLPGGRELLYVHVPSPTLGKSDGQGVIIVEGLRCKGSIVKS